MTLLQISSSHVDWLKNMATMGQGYFAEHQTQVLLDHRQTLYHYTTEEETYVELC